MNINIGKKFHIISFSYKTLSLEEREEFIKKGYREILDRCFEEGIIKGYVAVETCLRIELYIEAGLNFNMILLGDMLGAEKVKAYEGMEGVRHLLKVICGLESIIKGEDQILVQLKKAYSKSMTSGKTSALLNIIFNNAIETGKKFRSISRINERNLSLDAIAVKFIKSKFDSLENKRIFVIGVGDLSQSILALLHKSEDCHLIMTNRSMRKSIELQKVFREVETVEFSQKYETVRESDIIISATSAPHLVLEKDKMEELLQDGRDRFFLDLAVPRDIDINIAGMDNVMLYHLEDIWEEYNRNIARRDEITEEYFYIIEEQLEKLAEKLIKREEYRKDNNEREQAYIHEQ